MQAGGAGADSQKSFQIQNTNVQCLPNLLANKTKPNLTKAESKLGTAQPKLVSLLYLT